MPIQGTLSWSGRCRGFCPRPSLRVPAGRPADDAGREALPDSSPFLVARTRSPTGRRPHARRRCRGSARPSLGGRLGAGGRRPLRRHCLGFAPSSLRADQDEAAVPLVPRRLPGFGPGPGCAQNWLDKAGNTLTVRCRGSAPALVVRRRRDRSACPGRRALPGSSAALVGRSVTSPPRTCYTPGVAGARPRPRCAADYLQVGCLGWVLPG